MHDELKQLIENDLISNEMLNKLILLTRYGSHAYGTATAASDRDYRGIFIDDMDAYIGLYTEDNVTKTTGSQDRKNSYYDIDVTINGIRHFVNQALLAKVQALSVLYVDENDIIHNTPVGRLLRKNKDLFLTNQIKKSFGGFINNLRREFDKHDDPKKLMLAVMLYQQTTEAFKTGVLNVKRPNAEELVNIRNGKYAEADAIQLLNMLEQDFQKAYNNSVLPESPNISEINELLMELIITEFEYRDSADYIHL